MEGACVEGEEEGRVEFVLVVKSDAVPDCEWAGYWSYP